MQQSLPAHRDDLAPFCLELELSRSRERSLDLAYKLALIDPALVSAALGHSSPPIAAAPQPETVPTPKPDVSSTWAFIDECLKPADIKGARQPVPIDWLYSCYKAYCVAIGRLPIGENNWKSEVKSILPFNVVRRRHVGGEMVPIEWVWIDVRFGLFCFDNGAPKIIPTRLDDGGVAEFQQWARQYGPLYPYDRRTLDSDLAAMESSSMNAQG
ncbi:hypothetical protein H6F75_00530 [Nodosilinea sp. FACHB-131]|uniref:hypothetical protein n=1 Tax=Cyanophyceae TaxID=3028117 RepID=UPI0016869061|nr:hypothetical protein [Nodosilinea sp. FACHB-131]MBD1871956.1 hypothetical protein [Nodosilinea sp. FACHB-131]